MVELNVVLSDLIVAELNPYYDRFNIIRASAGLEPYTLEYYLTMVLTMGCHNFMMDNAELLERAASRQIAERDSNA